MEKSSKFKILDSSKIFPPPNSTSPISLPLTFLDIPWLFFSPTQPLFFFQYPHSTSFFLSSTLSTLKHSLSLSLQLYFPFLGNLTLSSPSNSNKPQIVYKQGDFVSFTAQESSSNFTFFTSSHPRAAHHFHPLVPELASTANGVPLLAVKVTVFPYSGICVGITCRHVAADERTLNNFIKAWSSLAAHSFPKVDLIPPSFDRSVIRDPEGLEEVFLKELWRKKSKAGKKMDLSNMVWATFLVRLSDMEKIKNLILAKCKTNNKKPPVILSSYVLTCSFIWVCLVKSQSQRPNEDPIYLGFVAGGLTRLKYPVPSSYFGNCVGFGRCASTRRELMGEDGIVAAANVIGSKIRDLNEEMMDGAEKWISDWEVLFRSDTHVMVSGSPKVDLYETDFGWGRPEKIEDISIEKDGAISLMESRDEKGGIEVGLALPSNVMQVFTSLFNQGLSSI